jgi:hemoglobin
VSSPSIYDRAGGQPAFLALAEAHHRRCLEDPELGHPFEHMNNPRHVEALADYWAEVFGGPQNYSTSGASHSSMLTIHAGEGAGSDLGERFLACFLQAIDDAGLPNHPDLRAALRAYMEHAVAEVMSYSPAGSVVEPALPTPRWGWHGLE